MSDCRKHLYASCGHLLLYSVKCWKCNKEHVIALPAEGEKAWQAGTLVQDAFPDLLAWEREMLISGTCNECWQEMFPACTEDGDEESV